MLSSVVAGSAAGLVLGALGAGGTVVGLPILLYLGRLAPHMALGTNAMGVAFIALALLIWRFWRGQLLLREGLLFTVPGLLGNYLGARLGLIFPGQKLIFLLGLLLFVVAGWLLYLSFYTPKSATDAIGPVPRSAAGAGKSGHWWLMVPVALAIGTIAGFFAIGGGFMIVPAMALIGGLDLLDAAAAGLVPITAFAGWIGWQYWAAASISLSLSALMLIPGIVGGVVGIGAARRLSKPTMQRVFAVFLVAVGVYMLVK